MFGRVRPSSSSPESLERPTSKIIKSDSLSIYEATLMKLKQGSQNDLAPLSEITVEMNNAFAARLPDDEEKIEEVCTSASVSSSLREISHHGKETSMDSGYSASVAPHPSGLNFKQRKTGSRSIVYLFSKYKNSQNFPSSACEAEMKTNKITTATPQSSDCQSCAMEQFHQVCSEINVAPPSGQM